MVSVAHFRIWKRVTRLRGAKLCVQIHSGADNASLGVALYTHATCGTCRALIACMWGCCQHATLVCSGQSAARPVVAQLSKEQPRNNRTVLTALLLLHLAAHTHVRKTCRGRPYPEHTNSIPRPTSALVRACGGCHTCIRNRNHQPKRAFMHLAASHVYYAKRCRPTTLQLDTHHLPALIIHQNQQPTTTSIPISAPPPRGPWAPPPPPPSPPPLPRRTAACARP